MATTTNSTSPRTRFGMGRVLFFLLIAVLLVALGALVWFYSMARSALPQLDGKVKVSGLSARVTVFRDGHGVPTIEAANLDDLFFAQGYVTAQDRLWQMDMMRRFAAGEVSEILGDTFLKHDREQRILGLRVAARKALEVASAQNRSHFEAYARGVNAYIESHRDRLPIEFRILRYSPRQWAPEDSTLIASQMVKDLNHYPYRDALEREKIQVRLGSDLTADLYVNSSWRDRPPTVTRPELDQDTDEENRPRRPIGGSVAETSSGADFQNLASASRSDSERMVIGSNNWVVSGAHTVSGKPLLSNDMHLGHQMPNLWYEAHLRCGNFDAAGVTLPGLPYVIVGHNQRIAWGFTNIGPTVEDLYIETFNPDGQYLTPEGWKAPEHRREVIHVKGKPDVTVDVAVTRHGPVITELIPGETRKLALRWTLYDGTHDPFFEVDSAQNWEQFRSAFSAFDAPGQNVVYADVDGNIGYQATGKIPIRASGDGSLPGKRQRQRARVDGIHSLRQAAQSLQSALRHHRNRQQPDHAGRISLLDQHGMGGSLAFGADLSRAGIGQEVFRCRHAGLADRHLFRGRPLFCGTVRVQRGPRPECFCENQTGRRNPAGVGWPHDRGLGGAHDRLSGPRRTGAPAARAQAGRRACGSQTSRG